MYISDLLSSRLLSEVARSELEGTVHFQDHPNARKIIDHQHGEQYFSNLVVEKNVK